MKDRIFLIAAIIGAVALYAGLLWYSLSVYRGQGGEAQASVQQTQPPKVVHHEHGVDVYTRRSVRSGTQRGGGLHGGK